MTACFVVHRFRPALDFNASVDADGEQNYLHASDIAALASVFARSMRSRPGPHGGDRGAMFQSDLSVELYRWLKDTKGWSDEEVRNPGSKSRIAKIYARVKDHMVAAGMAEQVMATVETATQALEGKTPEHSALRLLPGALGAFSSEDGEDELDGVVGAACGGGELRMNSTFEDQIVSVCKDAGPDGLRAHELAERFKHTAKDFGKKLELIIRFPHLYGIKQTKKQEGKTQVQWIHFTGVDTGTKTSKGDTNGGEKAADVMQRERSALLKKHLDEYGYVVKMWVPRLMRDWLGSSKSSTADSKYCKRLCDAMETKGELRIERVTVDTLGQLSSAETQDVLVAPNFPKLSEAFKRRIATEIAETQKATKQSWWSGDVYAITRPVVADGEAGEDARAPATPGGVSGRELAVSSTPIVLTFKNPGAKPRMRHAAMTDVMHDAGTTAVGTADKPLMFKTFRSLYSLESGYVSASAIRLQHFHGFLVDEVFGNDHAGSRDRTFNAGELCMERMPVELFLKLIPAPKKLCEEEPRMLATLQTLALNGKRLGELTPDQRIALVGTLSPPKTAKRAARVAAISTRQNAETKLANLLKWLNTMEIVEKIGTGVYRLADEARFQTKSPGEDEGTPVEGSGAWRTCRVDTRTGHGVFWRELESTFKGNDGSRERVADGSRKKIQPGVPQTYVTKPDMKGAFPSSRLAKNGLNPEKHMGICAKKTWSRMKDLTIRQRVVLLDELDKIRLNEAEIREQVAAKRGGVIAHADAAADAKENETDDANTNAEKLAARTVFLRGTNVLSADQMREIANRLTISFDVVSHFVQNDWKRVVNELTSDGTITRDDVTANRKRKAEMAQEKTDKRDRRELKKARRDAVDGRPERLVGLNAQTGSAAVRSTPDADTSEVADKLPADPMSQLGKVRLRWTREMDKALVMAVCRVQVVFGVPGGARKDIMRFAHSKGGGLPTDLERCRRRWQKLGRLKPGIMRAIDAFVPAMQGRGVLAREKAASERLLAVQRGDVPPADPAAAVDPDVNTWDTAGTWCVAVNDELERVVDDILETNPIAYTAAAEFHYARTRTGRDSDTDTDTEWQSDDEIPLARLVGVASDDSDSESESDSSASDESDDDVVVTARREPGDINGEALCEIAHAVELVKMLVSFRDEVGAGLDADAKKKGTAALMRMVHAVGNDNVEHAMGLLKRARMLQDVKDPVTGVVTRMGFTDRFVNLRDDVDAGDLGFAGCPAESTALHSVVDTLGAVKPELAQVRIPQRPNSAQVLAILAAVVSGDVELAPFDPNEQVKDEVGDSDVFGVEYDGEDVPENTLPHARVNLDVVVRKGAGHGANRGDDGAAAMDVDGANPVSVGVDAASESAVVSVVESSGKNGVTPEEVRKALSSVKPEPLDGTVTSETPIETLPIATLHAALKKAAKAGVVSEVNGFHSAPRYVSNVHAARFRLDTGAGPMIRPWLLPDGAVNAPFLDALKRRCVTRALKYPGVPERRLVEHMTPALTPGSAAELVQMLVDAEQLTFRVARGEKDHFGREMEPERYFFAPMDPRKWPMGTAAIMGN